MSINAPEEPGVVFPPYPLFPSPVRDRDEKTFSAADMMAFGFAAMRNCKTHWIDFEQRIAAPVLKGIGKVNGDGFKDTTRIGDVVFAWNTELPEPYSPGQFPRVGNDAGWTASEDQYEFQPATAAEVRALFDGLRSAVVAS